jgi:hypothetical protein
MGTKNLKLATERNILGTTIYLKSRDGSYNEVVAANLQASPLSNLDKTLTEGGYLFRSPKIKSHEWADMLKSLSNISGKFNITAKLTTDKNDADLKKVSAWIRFAEKDDAAIFAWTNVENWQKWSDTLEAEDQKEAKTRSKPLKAKVTKDGRITVKVTQVTLGK